MVSVAKSPCTDTTRRMVATTGVTSTLARNLDSFYREWYKFRFCKSVSFLLYLLQIFESVKMIYNTPVFAYAFKWSALSGVSFAPLGPYLRRTGDCLAYYPVLSVGYVFIFLCVSSLASGKL